MKLSNNTIQRLQSNYGNWALITGATSGIGREMAVLLGSAGFNLVITGRREHELEKLSSQLFDSNKIEVVPMAGDLSTRADLDALLNETAHLPIGIAILNAGYGTSGKFGETPLEQEVNMLRLNAESLMISAHHYINTSYTYNRRVALVFLSSIVSFQGTPYTANYAASKAYVQSLGEALSVELKDSNIDVLNAAPGPVNTGFSSRADLNMGKASHPEKIAYNILGAIGRKKTVFPDGMTKFMVYALRTLPRGVKIKIMGSVMKRFTRHQKPTEPT